MRSYTLKSPPGVRSARIVVGPTSAQPLPTLDSVTFRELPRPGPDADPNAPPDVAGWRCWLGPDGSRWAAPTGTPVPIDQMPKTVAAWVNNVTQDAGQRPEP